MKPDDKFQNGLMNRRINQVNVPNHQQSDVDVSVNKLK